MSRAAAFLMSTLIMALFACMSGGSKIEASGGANPLGAGGAGGTGGMSAGSGVDGSAADSGAYDAGTGRGGMTAGSGAGGTAADADPSDTSGSAGSDGGIQTDGSADGGGVGLGIAATRLQAAFVWGPGGAKAVVFRKSFTVSAPIGATRVHIFVDARYSLWINSRYLLTGPSRFDPKGPEFDSIDVTTALRAGNNTIAVLGYANPDQISGQHMTHAGGMAVWIEGAGVDIVSDTTWKASPNTRFAAPTVTWSNILESVDARREYDSLSDTFDDTGWAPAVKVDGSSWGPLTPRAIPLLAETVLAPTLPFTLPASTGSFDATFDKSYVVMVQIDFEAVAGTTIGILGNTYVARAGRQIYRTIDTFGFGLDGNPIVHITTSANILVHDVQFINRVYPFTVGGTFASSDVRLDRLWAISVHTILQLSEDGYEDCPWERSQWTGDIAAVEYPTTRVALIGPSHALGDPRLVRKMLKNMGESQQPDGRIKAHAPSNRFDIHGYIEDYACLWIQTLRQYYDSTGDKAFVESVWPVLTKQQALFLSLRQPSGLVRGREFVIFDNPIAYQVVEGATLNAFIYKALQDSAYLATELGRSAEAAGYLNNAIDLGAAFNTALWDGTAYKASTTVTVSGARAWYANMIALAQGIVPPDRAPGLREGLLANAASLSDTLYPYTHHWLFQDLYDMDTAAADTFLLELIRRRWANTFGPGNLGMVTDESLGPRNFHNFGAAPAYFLAASVLGVTSDGPVSNNRLIIRPRLGNLTFARGIVVTEHGEVPVSWTRDAATGITFSFDVPFGTRARVLLPNDSATPLMPTLTFDTQSMMYAVQGRYIVFEVGAGSHTGVLGPGG